MLCHYGFHQQLKRLELQNAFAEEMLNITFRAPRVGDGLCLLSISRVRHDRYRALQRANRQRGAAGTMEPSHRMSWLPLRGADGQDQLEAVMPPHC